MQLLNAENPVKTPTYGILWYKMSHSMTINGPLVFFIVNPSLQDSLCGLMKQWTWKKATDLSTVYSKFPSLAKFAVTSWMACDDMRPWTRPWSCTYVSALQIWLKTVTIIASVNLSCCNKHQSDDRCNCLTRNVFQTTTSETLTNETLITLNWWS